MASPPGRPNSACPAEVPSLSRVRMGEKNQSVKGFLGSAVTGFPQDSAGSRKGFARDAVGLARLLCHAGGAKRSAPPLWPSGVAFSSHNSAMGLRKRRLVRIRLPAPGRGKDAMLQAARRARHGARRRQTGRRAANPRGDPEPLHGPWNAANSARGMTLFKGRGSSACVDLCSRAQHSRWGLYLPEALLSATKPIALSPAKRIRNRCLRATTFRQSPYPY